MKNITTSDDILGKECLDPKGGILGIVVRLHIDRESKRLVGLTVDQGLVKPDLYVGIDYVKLFGVDSVLLSRLPEELYKNLEVLDPTGKLVGVVKDYELDEKGRLKSLSIKKRTGTFSSINVKIPVDEIREIGSRVFLK